MSKTDPTRFISSDTTQPVWYTLDAHIGPPSDTLSGAEVDVTPLPISFFTTSKRKEPKQEPALRYEVDNDWLLGSFALLLLLIVVLRLTWRQHIADLFRAMVFPSAPTGENRVFGFYINSFSVIFMVIYGIAFSLLALSVASALHANNLIYLSHEPLLFFLFAAGFIALLSVKIALSWLVDQVFQTRDAGQTYRDHLLLSAFTSAAIITPLVVVDAFSSSPIPLFVTLLLMLSLLMVRLFRTLRLGMMLTPFSFLHNILYFCTLEIIPLVLAGKGVDLFLAGS